MPAPLAGAGGNLLSSRANPTRAPRNTRRVPVAAESPGVCVPTTPRRRIAYAVTASSSSSSAASLARLLGGPSITIS